MNLFQQNGAQPQKPPRFTPIFIDRTFTGLYTQRSPLHDPSDLITARFYGGRPDTLIGGLNVELTNRNTLARRCGISAFSAATYPTAPTRAFEFRLTNNTIQVLIDTPTAVYWDQQNGSKTLLYTKQTGASQAFFVSIGDICYIGDGVSLLKYTPGNANGTIWNYTIAGPASAPSVVTTASGSAAVSWRASTVFSTFGIIIDSNGNAQQLISVALNGNLTQFGTTGQGQPAWNQTQGGTVTETSGAPITWKNLGQIQQWKGNTFYANQAPIYDPVTNCVFTNFAGSGGTSGGTKPNFNPTLGSITQDNNGSCKWGNVGKVGSVQVNLWFPSTNYASFDTLDIDRMLICEPILPTAGNTAGANLTTIYLQASQTTGLSGSGYTPPWATTAGLPTQDGNNVWICLGTATWSAGMTAVAWAQGQAVFTVVQDSGTPKNLWVCTKGGSTATGFTFPTSPNYGDQATDANGVVWTCLGPVGPSWVVNQTWYLPVTGWAPPSATQAYASPSVKDSNGNIQFVTTSGTSGSTAPTWSAVQNSLNATVDNTAKWTMGGVYSQNSISWSKGHVYAYSFKARAATDNYVTQSLLVQAGNPTSLTYPFTIPGLTTPLGNPLGSGSGGISTSSPAFIISGPNTGGAVNTVSGVGSTDPQVDTIVIYRDADGGGIDNMFELVEIPAPPPVNGTAQPWSFQDFLPDVPSNVNNIIFPGLNNLLPAPIDGANDPPPAGFLPMAYHFGRIWGAVGTNIFFSGGPDVLSGNPNEAYSEDDSFEFLSNVNCLLHTANGLFVYTTSDIEVIAGGPTTASFYQDIIAAGIGLLSFNALTMHGGEIYFLSSEGQLFVMNASAQLVHVGFPIGDLLATLNPASVYLTYHSAGTDDALYVGNGSTGWFRLNPHQVPGGSQGPEQIWSPFAQITGGCQLIQSVEVSPGVHKLLVGPTGTNASISERNTTVFTDNGTAYSANFTMGSIVVAQPGEIAAIKFIACDFAAAGSQPIVGVLFNEISGTFTTMTKSVSDPPSVYGATGSPTSLFSNRYYIGQNQMIARCRHLQIQVNFGNDTVQNEIHNLTIYGRLFVER